MKKKQIGFFVFFLIFILVYSNTISASQGADLEIDISDAFESKSFIVRYYHGVQIENIGDETATGIAVNFWVTGGIFSKLRELLKMRDFWEYGCGKIEPGEKVYCPIHLNLLYLGNINLKAKVWADNAEPVTKTINGFSSIAFIWVNFEE
ncbi:MAG: hypothetical protein JSU91_01555 [Thermoplasmatales archaeon]|nr:MAG: hypothetical protein JSU91_01555 [Thermoplasmatales archaeon]